MKTLSICTFLFSIAIPIHTQTSAAAAPQDTPYAVVSRGPHSSVWERKTYSQVPSGDWVTNVDHYVETATGLNYWDPGTGQYQPSSENIVAISGGAAAQYGQHKVTFASDLATAGAIGLQTPDGQQLSLHLLGLCYADQSSGKSVWIAEVTNSIGQIIGSNQVWYGNAFSGISGSVSYVNTLQGLEQNVVLEAQPSPPEAYGLSSATSVLQAITEFVSPPAPAITTNATDGGETLQFGTMQFARGSAFLMGNNSGGVAVQKQWVTQNGRWFLVEQVPIAQIARQLDALPTAQTASIKRKRGSVLNVVSKRRLWPAGFAKNTSKGAKMLSRGNFQQGNSTGKQAERAPSAPAFVLDYVTLNTSQSNMLFQADTTYFLSGNVSLYGTNTVFEGGTVLKYTNGASLTVDTPVSWLAGPYRPVLMLSMDDNSCGDGISGSTGNPGNSYFAATALFFDGTSALTNLSIENLRIANASVGVALNGQSGHVLDDVQLVNCGNGIAATNTDFRLHNALFDLVLTNFTGNTATGRVEQLTSDTAVWLNQNITNLFLTNCLLTAVTNLQSCTTAYVTNLPNGSGIFQSVGAGNYYLAADSPYRNAGTTNISADSLRDIANKTTYPPILYSNVVFSNNLTLNPQAQRDYDTPDLGYHYDPIDYLADRFWVTNATLIVTNGAVLAGYNDYDVIVTDGSSINSFGTPLAPNWFTRYSSVQEQPLNLGIGAINPGSAYMVYPYNATNEPAGLFRFTKFSCPAGGGYHVYDNSQNFAFSNLLVQDCEFWGGQNDFSGYNNTFAVLKNSLFARSTISTQSASFTNNNFAVSNNLFWNIQQFSVFPGANSNTWFFFNNDFDNSPVSSGRLVELTINGYNAYLVNTNRLKPTNAFDIVTNTDIAYQTGPLGAFYQPTNSMNLINLGSTNANLVGLYHYTTTTNELKESNSIVDIGYHYVALDGNGNPVDSNGDGIPDYLEDANGNGLVDSGEIGWNINGDLGLKVFITRPKNNSIIP